MLLEAHCSFPTDVRGRKEKREKKIAHAPDSIKL